MATKTKAKKELALNENEKQLIENQRAELQKIESFKSEYQELVEKYEYAWVVDSNSTLSNPLLGLAKVKFQEK